MNKDSLFCIRGKSFDSGGGWCRGGGPCVPTICGRCAPRPGVCAGLVAPAATDARDAAPREQVVRLGSSLPEVGAGGPHTPMRGRSAPPPRVTFPSRGKSPKARQGLPPFGIPPMRKIRPYWCCAALAPGLPSATKNRPICHFRFVNKSALFSPSVSSRKHSLLSIRGAASALPPRMLEGLIDGERYR